jgi:hypothetical protein
MLVRPGMLEGKSRPLASMGSAAAIEICSTVLACSHCAFGSMEPHSRMFQ